MKGEKINCIEVPFSKGIGHLYINILSLRACITLVLVVLFEKRIVAYCKSDDMY